MAITKRSRSRFANVRKLSPARWQARYTGPDARTHKAHVTFDTKGDAEQRPATLREIWRPRIAAAAPQVRALTFGDYSTTWLKGRKVRGGPLADRTSEHYQSLLDRFLLPTLSDVPLRSITPELVDKWYEQTVVDTPTYPAHAYGLLRTILASAVNCGPIRTANPAKVHGGRPSASVRCDPSVSPSCVASTWTPSGA